MTGKVGRETPTRVLRLRIRTGVTEEMGVSDGQDGDNRKAGEKNRR